MKTLAPVGLEGGFAGRDAIRGADARAHVGGKLVGEISPHTGLQREPERPSSASFEKWRRGVASEVELSCDGEKAEIQLRFIRTMLDLFFEAEIDRKNIEQGNRR